MKMFQEKSKGIRFSDGVLIFDRDLGKLVFRDFKGYGSLLDDAEWLLERTPQRSWGFMMRPIIKEGSYGLWIGEYEPENNRVVREEVHFSRGASTISKLLLRYAVNKISERVINKMLNVDTLRNKLPESNIIQDFKYFICPEERLYSKCPRIEEIYRAILKRSNSVSRLHYSQVAEIISRINKCNDVIICPLTAPPNAFERLFTLNKVLRSRRMGEINIYENVIKVFQHCPQGESF
ncbi:MAG: hypothetical protein QXE14_02140 [Candidatus Bathyarchaeia archaeon]